MSDALSTDQARELLLESLEQRRREVYDLGRRAGYPRLAHVASWGGGANWGYDVMGAGPERLDQLERAIRTWRGEFGTAAQAEERAADERAAAADAAERIRKWGPPAASVERPYLRFVDLRSLGPKGE